MEQPRPIRRMNPMGDKVQVAVRLRPHLKRELCASKEKKSAYWSVSPTSITQCVDEKPVPFHSFSFDHIFPPNSTNEFVFDGVARPLVASAVDGINGVIFAYGQTAAGKTHTMLGNKADPGITLRSISDVFERISKLPSRAFLLRASYIEIYNEIIRDLLVPSNDNLKIHEDAVSNMVYVNSHRKVITSVEDAMKIISAGEAVRSIGATNMNGKASRSHTIFTISIESREFVRSNDDLVQNSGVALRNSTLALVDLAGSERASLTKAHGKRLTEGCYINKSLLTLGTVIKKLSSESSKVVHIPYRDSKLTRLLQPALGGNARTVIICAVTTAVPHMEETLSTLKFASRAKRVTNNAETNEFLDDRAKLRRAEEQIASLKKELRRLRSCLAATGPQASADEVQTDGRVKHSWELEVKRTISEITSSVGRIRDECPRCLIPMSVEGVRERKARVRLLRTLMENSPKILRSEDGIEQSETVETLFSSVKQLKDKLLVKDMELVALERPLETPEITNDIGFRPEYAESDGERPMSVCTSDETMTQVSLDSNVSSRDVEVLGRNSSEVVNNLRRSFEEKKSELEDLFRRLSVVKRESKHDTTLYASMVEGTTMEGRQITPTEHKAGQEGKPIMYTNKANGCLQSFVPGATEWKTDTIKKVSSDFQQTGDRDDVVGVPELERSKGGLSKLTIVVRRVMIASCAILFHCGISKLLNFGTNRGLVGISVGNVTGCSS